MRTKGSDFENYCLTFTSYGLPVARPERLFAICRFVDEH